jgi:hypothetical protein
MQMCAEQLTYWKYVYLAVCQTSAAFFYDTNILRLYVCRHVYACIYACVYMQKDVNQPVLKSVYACMHVCAHIYVICKNMWMHVH